MHKEDEQSPEDYFPSVESFTDFIGKQREFVIELMAQPSRYFLQAKERRPPGNGGGYEFAAYSPVDPFFALGLLRGKIRKGLATRYLTQEHGHRSLSHDRMRGHIGYGGVVVDGAFISFEELCFILDTYEGFHFSLTITDPYDEEAG